MDRNLVVKIERECAELDRLLQEFGTQTHIARGWEAVMCGATCLFQVSLRQFFSMLREVHAGLEQVEQKAAAEAGRRYEKPLLVPKLWTPGKGKGVVTGKPDGEKKGGGVPTKR